MFIILGSYHLDSLFVSARMQEVFVVFRNKKGPREQERLGNTMVGGHDCYGYVSSAVT
jgi:hypothetical protein